MSIYQAQSHDAWLEAEYEARFETGDDFVQESRLDPDLDEYPDGGAPTEETFEEEDDTIRVNHEEAE
jgi:hypothetical protein